MTDKMEFVFEHEIKEKEIQDHIRKELFEAFPEISEVTFGGAVKISAEKDLNPHRLEDIILRVRFVARGPGKEVVYEHDPGVRFQVDPFPYLKGTRQVVRVAEGQYLIEGEFLALMKALDNMAVRVAEGLHAREQEYPSFVPVNLLKRINYFKDFPHHVVVAAGVKQERGALRGFSEQHDFKKKQFDTLNVDGILEDVELVAAPSVCYTCYYALMNQQLEANQIVTAVNRCTRNEPEGFTTLRRLRNFTMREIIFLGEREYVLSQRQKMLDSTKELMIQLELSGRIESAHDPFFTNDAAYKAVFQHSFRLKYECVAHLPFCNEYLAICSINLHNDSFGKAFGVRLKNGESMHSGCVGFGLERWAYAFLSQHGWDRSRWPSCIEKAIGQ